MIWFFSRDTDQLRIEMRYDNDSAQYVLVMNWPDGRRHVERFSTLSDFSDRVVELQRTIDVEGWHSFRSPQILRDGWRIA